MMRLLYKPFGIIGGIIAAQIGRKAFDSIWTKIDDQPPPRPGTGQSTVVKVIGAQALRASVMAASAAAVDRVLLAGFTTRSGSGPRSRQSPRTTSRRPDQISGAYHGTSPARAQSGIGVLSPVWRSTHTCRVSASISTAPSPTWIRR